MSIRNRILIPLALIMFVGLTALCIVATVFFNRLSERRILDTLSNLETFITASPNFPLTESTVRYLSSAYGVEIAVFVDKKIDPSRSTISVPIPTEHWKPVLVGEKEYLPYLIPRDGGREIVLLYPSEKMQEEKTAATRLIVLSTVIIYILTLGIIAYAAKKLSAPIERLADESRAIATGEKAEFTVQSAVREIEQLRTSMQNMLVKVIESHEKAITKEMALSMAHEIKNPLTTVKGAVDKLPPSSEKKMIIEEIERIDLCTSEILFLAGQPTKSERVSIIDCVEEAVEMSKGRAAYKSVGVKASDVCSGEVEVDRIMIRRVLSSLIDNAIEASPAGEFVSIMVTIANGRAQFVIANKYEHAPDMNRLFVPFSSGKKNSTGIGLYIAKRFAEASGGEISARVDGIVFRVSLSLPATLL